MTRPVKKKAASKGLKSRLKYSGMRLPHGYELVARKKRTSKKRK
jgi:hypothetical protein